MCQIAGVPRGTISHVVGFDDAPFDRERRGDVGVIGAVYAGLRLEGVLCGAVRRDGSNAAQRLIDLVARSQFATQLQLVMLQGVALAGFNVVDVHAVHGDLGVPVLVVARRRPRMTEVKRALLQNVPNGAKKWQLIERLGAPEALAGVFVQRVGITRTQAADVIARLAVHGKIPEPLRTAHLIAGAMATGKSRGRV